MHKALGVGLGFWVGLGAGALLGVLFAPRSGEDTRKMVHEKMMAAQHHMKHKIAKKKAELQQKTNMAADEAEAAIERGRRAADEAAKAPIPPE